MAQPEELLGEAVGIRRVGQRSDQRVVLQQPVQHVARLVRGAGDLLRREHAEPVGEGCKAWSLGRSSQDTGMPGPCRGAPVRRRGRPNASSLLTTGSTTSFISAATTSRPASIEPQGPAPLRCGPTSAGLLPYLELRANVALSRPRNDNLTVLHLSVKPLPSPFLNSGGNKFYKQVLLGAACLENHRAQLFVERNRQPEAGEALRDVLGRQWPKRRFLDYGRALWRRGQERCGCRRIHRHSGAHSPRLPFADQPGIQGKFILGHYPPPSSNES